MARTKNNGQVSANSSGRSLSNGRRLSDDTSEHEARLVLARAGEDWGEAVFAIRIAPFARDVLQHLDELTLDDLNALIALGRAALQEMERRETRQKSIPTTR